MPEPSRSTSHHVHARRSLLARITAGTCLLVTAALIAAGCGGDGAKTGLSMQAVADIRADGGPLRWLDPDTTWLVAAGKLDPEQLDAALETLDRLPVWSLAESMLPASDGAGMRAELLKLLAGQLSEQGGAGSKVTAAQLEDAFGEHFGLAITSTDFTQLSQPNQDEFPLVLWVEVDDRDAALNATRALADGKVTEHEHEGVDYLLDEGFGAVAVHDELLLFASSEQRIKQHIEVYASTDSLAENDDARAVVEAGINESLAGVAVATDPLLAAVPQLAASELDEDSPVTAAQLERMLGSDEVDDMLPDWIATSLTVDETGLRSRTAWSNPRALAAPPVSSRELVERTPATTAIVGATVSDGSELARVQRVWKQAAATFDIDLRTDVGDACTKETSKADRWACALVVELLTTVLEDGSLASAINDAPDAVAAYGIDVTDLRQYARAAADAAGTDRMTALAAGPVYHMAWSGSMQLEGWTPSRELTAAMDAAGLQVSADDETWRIRVLPGSPIRRELADMSAQDRRALDAMLGVDTRTLLTGEGLVIRAERVDDVLSAMAFPLGTKAAWADALNKDADAAGALGQDETYQEVVKAAGVPDKVGMYGYIGLLTLIDADWADVIGRDNTAVRALPAIRNNLADVPGIVSWSERQSVDGEQVGLIQMVLPILD